MIKASNNTFECTPAIINTGGGTTYSGVRAQYNGTSVTVPAGFTLTRIVSLNDINTSFTGVVTGTNLVITDGVTDDIYLIDGYIN